MFKFLRKALSWGVRKGKKKIYPHSYLVTVYVDHPQVIGHVNRFQIAIDARSAEHARDRLNSELTFFIGRAYKE